MKFDALFNLNIVPIGFWSSEGRILDANDALLQLIEMSREEFESSEFYWTDITPPEYLEEEMAIAQQIIQGVRTPPFYKELQLHSGRRIPIVVAGQWLPESDCGIVVAINISEQVHAESQRSRAEMALAQAEEHLRLAVEAAHIGTWDMNPITGQIHWSPQCKMIFGVPLDHSPNYEDLLQRLHPDDRDKTNRVVERALDASGSGEYHTEYRISTPEGSLRWIAARGRAFFDEIDGKRQPIRFIGTVIDITESKRTTERNRLLSDASAILASSLDYEKTLQAVAHLAVPTFADCCVVDSIGDDGVIIELTVAHCNPAKEELLRELRRVELLDMERGAGPERVLTTGELNWKRDFTNEDFDAHVTSARARQIHRELGVIFYIAVPLRVRERVLGIISFCLAESGRRYEEDDLEFATELAARAANAVDNACLYRAAERAREEAERLKAEAEEARAAAEASQAEAEAASRAKDEFLATLSHELRTPLNAILGWSHLMATRQLDEESSIRAAEVIERNVRVQAQLLGDMFDVSRIITGKLSLNAHPLEVAPVVDNAVEAVLSSAQAKNISLQVQSECSLFINGDSTRLQQIIWNLLSNAVRFTPQDGAITVRVEREENEAKLSVRDSGQGIEPDFLPFVFDRFRQADSSSTRRYGGMGLGLSIVRHLTEMHGGRVAVHSGGLGQGSTFVVHLPLLRDENADATFTENTANAVAWPQPEHQLLSNDVLSGLRVLVVDDEADSLELACSVLEYYNATTQRALSARDALEIIQRETFDILVSDISMPEEDGCDLLEKIRALQTEIKSIPAIALTALARADDRKRVFASGFQEHLPKPFDPAALVIAVAGLTGRL